jgi:hypothetical protein
VELIVMEHTEAVFPAIYVLSLTCSPKSLPGIIWKAWQRVQKRAIRIGKTKFTEEQMMDAVQELEAQHPAKDLALRRRTRGHEPARLRLL